MSKGTKRPAKAKADTFAKKKARIKRVRGKKLAAAREKTAWPTKADMIEGLRNGLYTWWHQTRDLLGKVLSEAEQMAKEIADKPDGPLAAIVEQSAVVSLVNAVENVIKEYLSEVVIRGRHHVYAPSERMYDTARGGSQ